MAVGKNITWKKERVRGSNIIFPIILRLLGKNIKRGKGEGRKVQEENQDLKKWNRGRK